MIEVDILSPEYSRLIAEELAHLVRIEVVSWVVAVVPTAALLSLDQIWATDQDDWDELVWERRVGAMDVVGQLISGALLRRAGTIVAQGLRMRKRNGNFSGVI